MNERYYTVDDMEVHEQFIKIPLVLLEDEYYRDLSNEAKLAYGVLSDRLTLSYKNKKDWTDENGRVYIVYTNEQLCQILNKTNKTIVKIKKELQEKGLLIEKYQGANRPNLLYPIKPKTGSVKNTRQGVENLHTGSVKNTRQGVENLHTNQTDINQTDITNISADKAESNLQILSDYYQQEIGVVSPKQWEQLRDYLLADGFELELIQLAIDKAANNAKRSFGYVNSILRNWRQAGITTLVQAEEEDRRFKESRGVSRNTETNIPKWSSMHPDNQKKTELKAESKKMTFEETMAFIDEVNLDDG